MVILNIKEFRNKNKFTQKELAKKVQISQSYLSKLERNIPAATNGVSLGVIIKIAKALNVSPKKILILQ